MRVPMRRAALGRASLTRLFAQRIGNHRSQGFFSTGANGLVLGIQIVPDPLRRALYDAEDDGGSGVIYAICSERIAQLEETARQAG